MLHTSGLYQTMLRDPRHQKECYVRIAGEDYHQDRLVSLSTSGGAFASPDIGTCASRQIDLLLRNPGEIPRQAELRAYVRLRLGGQASEWLPKGVYYISTRKLDKRTGTLAIHGFDAMLKASDVWLTEDYAPVNWPMPQRVAVEDIAYRMGVEVDPRTVVTDGFPIPYPADETGEDITMLDILEFIAVCNAGNWVISDEGRLLLLRYGDIPPETNYLVTEYGSAITLGGVKILVG